jgi:hypothetical protein
MKRTADSGSIDSKAAECSTCLAGSKQGMFPDVKIAVKGTSENPVLLLQHSDDAYRVTGWRSVDHYHLGLAARQVPGALQDIAETRQIVVTFDFSDLMPRVRSAFRDFCPAVPVHICGRRRVDYHPQPLD